MIIKSTKSQEHILSLLKQIHQEISAQQLYLELHNRGSKIGLATIYRSLKKLHHQGIIQERTTSGGESVYRLIENAHQHHLNCIRCGQSVILEDCPLEQKLNQWCQSQQFTVYYHTLEFFGVCADCHFREQ